MTVLEVTMVFMNCGDRDEVEASLDDTDPGMFCNLTHDVILAKLGKDLDAEVTPKDLAGVINGLELIAKSLCASIKDLKSMEGGAA